MAFVIDTETSGLPSRRNANPKDIKYFEKCRIVSVCWIVLDKTDIVKKKVHHIVKPEGFEIPQEAINIHGITNEKASISGIPIEIVATELLDDLNRFKPTRLVAHNIKFDYSILLSEMYRLPDSESKQAIIDQLIALKKKCTMEAGTPICAIPSPWGKDQFKYPNLKELHDHLYPGTDMVIKHEALYDTEKCVECYLKIKSIGNNNNAEKRKPRIKLPKVSKS